ncbi:MAG: response regulator [Acidimicrobiales bacterium]
MVRTDQAGSARTVTETGGRMAVTVRAHEGALRGPVLVVEDHALLARSLAVVLAAAGWDVQVAEPSGQEELLTLAASLRPAVVLLDLHLGEPLGSGLPLIGPLGRLGSRVIVVTGEGDDYLLAQCLEAGAAGLASKSDPFEVLTELLGLALDGDPLVPDRRRRELAAHLAGRRREERERQAAFGRLTARERSVLVAIMDGAQAAAIARASFTSLATVRAQIRAILSKLDVGSQLEAVALARRAGWTGAPAPAPPGLGHRPPGT